MFQQEAELREGISAVDTVVAIKKDINNYFQAPVMNQREMVMFREESEVFETDDTDIGNLEHKKMNKAER